MLCLCFQQLCVLSSGLLAGVVSSIAVLVIPCMLTASNPQAVWNRFYKQNSALFFSLLGATLVSAVVSLFQTGNWMYVLGLGTNCLSLVYTVKLMGEQYAALNKKRGVNDQLSREQTVKLLREWNGLHWGRVLINGVAFAIYVCAATKK